MAKSFHEKPFDEGTKFKLSILQEYLREWLPVFLAADNPIWNTVNIFDFFAGPGYDIEKSEGSPLIILNELNKYLKYLEDKNITLRIYLNEYDKHNFNKLEKLIQNKQNSLYKIKVTNFDFEKSFKECHFEMINCANFLFFDQSGVKFITPEIFNEIINLKGTDFIFFISSSFFKRFKDDDNFKRYIDIKEFDTPEYYNIHRKIFDYYKSLIPKDKQYFIAPFSIKKGANIYGLIFGTNHPLGIYKFLNVC